MKMFMTKHSNKTKQERNWKFVDVRTMLILYFFFFFFVLFFLILFTFYFGFIVSDLLSECDLFASQNINKTHLKCPLAKNRLNLYSNQLKFAIFLSLKLDNPKRCANEFVKVEFELAIGLFIFRINNVNSRWWKCLCSILFLSSFISLVNNSRFNHIHSHRQ